MPQTAAEIYEAGLTDDTYREWLRLREKERRERLAATPQHATATEIAIANLSVGEQHDMPVDYEALSQNSIPLALLRDSTPVAQSLGFVNDTEYFTYGSCRATLRHTDTDWRWTAYNAVRGKSAVGKTATKSEAEAAIRSKCEEWLSPTP